MEGLHFNGLHLNENDNDKLIRESNGDVNLKEKENSESYSNSYSSTVDYDPDKIEAGGPHDARNPTRKAHLHPVDTNVNAGGTFPESPSPSMVRSDRERQILIMMLLAQVCAMHDSTPKTFTIYLLSLHEQGMLDYENSIGFLCGMGLIPEQLRLPPAAVPVPSVIPVSQSQPKQRSQPQSPNEDPFWQQEPQNDNDNAAAIVPYKPPTHANASTETTSNYSGNDETDGIQTTHNAEAHSRMLQVRAIRRHLESSESSPKNSDRDKKNKKNSTSTKHQSNVNFAAGIQNILDNPLKSLSSWAVEDHPLSVSRYSREFIQRKQLASGSFGQVFLATNKLDDCDYAVKKIIFAAKGYDTKEIEMVIKEVKCLAKLDHENVVRYYTSWLEPTWTMTGNTSSPTIITDGTDHNQRGEDEKVAVSCPDEVASKDVQRKMLSSIEQLVYGDIHDSKSTDGHTLNHNNIMGDASTSYDCTTAANYGHGGKGLCAWSFDDSNSNQIRNADSWNQLPSYNSNNDPILSDSISTGGYGEDSECSEWTIDQQQSSAGNFRVQHHNTNHHTYSHRQGHHQRQKQREKSYRYKICLFIQMQLCDPSTLADWIRRRNSSRNLPSKTLTKKWCKNYEAAWEVFLQIVQGLAHVHSQGVLHRDLKPANIFSANDGLFKVGDFGLSTMLNKLTPTSPTTDGGGGMRFVGENDTIAEHDFEEVDDLTALTLASEQKQFGGDEWQNPLTAGIGTATYAAPEQIVSNSYGPKADIFSLGLILLELFCSFGSEHERATTFHDCRRGKLPLWIISAYPFENVANLIISCTKPNPSERPTANEILNLNIYKESLTTAVVAEIQEETITNGLQLEIQRRDEVIAEQSKLILEKDALLEKQTRDLKLMEDSLERLIDRSNNKINNP